MSPLDLNKSAGALVVKTVRGEDRRLGEIGDLYRQRYPSFLRVAVAIVGDDQLGSDAVQDAFAGIVRSRDTYRGRGTLEAWVWRAIVNAARTSRQRRLAAQAVALGGDASAADAGASDPGGVRSAVAQLPERQRLVVFLRYFADLDYRTIATVLGIRRGTVAATLHAAHEALRTALEEEQACLR